MKTLGIDSIIIKERFRQVNTTISELLFCSLSNELGYNIKFEKNYEFKINEKVVEVKTIHPRFENMRQFTISENQMRDSDIREELLKYVKKPEIKDNHLMKAIEKQKAEIIFLNITFADEAPLVKWFSNWKKEEIYVSFAYALSEAINSTNRNVIPLIVTTGSISFDYQIYAICLQLPVRHENKVLKLDL